MYTLSEKIQNIKVQNARLRRLKNKRRIAVRDFRCVETEKMAYAGEPFIEYEYCVDVPHVCRWYDSCHPCKVKNCPNHTWNSQYIDLIARLDAVRRLRNQAILDLFKIRNK